jgi:predicted nucleic acid-binding protein
VKIVLDASAAVDIVAQRGRGSHFLDDLDRSDAVIAPDLIVSELANACWKEHRFSGLSVSAAQMQLDLALELIEEFVPAIELYRRAFELARNARRPAYDMFYVALALRDRAVLMTSDPAVKKEAERQGAQVF